MLLIVKEETVAGGTYRVAGSALDTRSAFLSPKLRFIVFFHRAFDGIQYGHIRLGHSSVDQFLDCFPPFQELGNLFIFCRLEKRRILIDQLLALRAPAPDWRAQAKERQVDSPVCQDARAQARDIPTEELLAIWEDKLIGYRRGPYNRLFEGLQDGFDHTDTNLVPARVQTQLLAGCQEYPAYLPKLLDGLPVSR